MKSCINMNKDSFFKLVLDFNDRFRDVFPYILFSVSPFCICVELDHINNSQLEDFICFLSLRDIHFDYSFYYVQIGVRLVFTFNVV